MTDASRDDTTDDEALPQAIARTPTAAPTAMRTAMRTAMPATTQESAYASTSLSTLSDAVLVRCVLEGNTVAFTVLVDRHAPACLRLATRMLQNRHDAEDVTQQTLVRAYRALARYDEREQFRAWLFAILLNRCRTAAQLRSRRWQLVAPGLDNAPEIAVPPDVAAAELREDIVQALAALDLPHREAFLLKHVEQLSYDEMATATGVGVSALKMRVKRACERLQGLLGGTNDDGI